MILFGKYFLGLQGKKNRTSNRTSTAPVFVVLYEKCKCFPNYVASTGVEPVTHGFSVRAPSKRADYFTKTQSKYTHLTAFICIFPTPFPTSH